MTKPCSDIDLAKEICDFVENCDGLALIDLYQMIFNKSVVTEDYETYYVTDEEEDESNGSDALH